MDNEHNEAVLQWAGKKKSAKGSYCYRKLQTVYPNVCQNTILTRQPTPGNNRQLILGSDQQVIAWLLDNGFQRRFDCIYLDPPYLSNTSYYAQIKIDTDDGPCSVKQPVFHDSGYRNIADYLQHLYETIYMIKQLLSEQGSLFVHLDHHSAHYVKVIMDEIFTPQRFINEIVWCYGGGSGTRRHFHRKHDVILWYSQGPDYIFNPQHRPYSPGTLQRGLTKVKGGRYKLDIQGALLQDWWTDIPKILSPTSVNNWKFPTQKPVELVQRIIQACTVEDSLVGDFYAGSGTTGEACENLGRSWIISDSSVYGFQTSIHRLIRNNSRPFIIGATQPVPDAPGKLTVKIEPAPRLFAHEFAVILQSYEPGGDRPDGLFWIDFWELGWLEGNSFISLTQAIPAKRGQKPPSRLTFVAGRMNEPLAVQIWDIQGGQARLPVTAPEGAFPEYPL